MESASDDDEFFDAAENLSFTKLRSESSLESGTETNSDASTTTGNHDEDTNKETKDVILPHDASEHLETDDVPNKSRDENTSTAGSSTSQTSQTSELVTSCDSIEVTQTSNDIIPATSSDIIPATSSAKIYSDSINNNIDNRDDKNVTGTSRQNVIGEQTLKSLNITSANEVVPIATSLPTSPIGPAPVAPPRRKKKTKPKELTVDTGKDNVGPSSDVKLSIREMNQVLETGNSQEVVSDVISKQTEEALGTTTTSNKESSSQAGTANNAQATSSTCQLTDEEILGQVSIKNLDTGETIPLSMAEGNLPECTNPLALHILRLATEEDIDPNLPSSADQGDEDGHLSDVSTASGGRMMQGKRKKLKKFLGKTVQKIKSVADEVSQQVRKGEESSSSEDEQEEGDDGYIKFKNHRAKKDRLLFDRIKLLQDLSNEHIGAVWTMKFSLCGKLLATAGQDNVVRVWVLKEAALNFEEMRRKYSRPLGRTSPTGSMASSTSTASADDELQIDLASTVDDDNTEGPFRAHPFVRYHGHTSDVLDLSWSKNYFLLSSSMDKTVRLWHISRQECLCCFQHVDFVTAICFHPRDDRYFLSGSLDGKIRLWNIPEKKVALWNELDGYGTSLVTAANFCQNGKLAVVGTYDGRCIFYDTEKLKYHTQVTVRSSRGKNARGRKISGIEPMPGEDKVLITSNDSRIRLYDLKDHSLYCKYKGLQNESSQIRANFSHDGKLILCGSEDKYVYIWRTHHDVLNVRKDRNEYYESFSAHDAVVTAAIFAPFPTSIIEKPPQDSTKEHSTKPFEIIVAADWQGGVKLYINR